MKYEHVALYVYKLICEHEKHSSGVKQSAFVLSSQTSAQQTPVAMAEHVNNFLAVLALRVAAQKAAVATVARRAPRQVSTSPPHAES